MKKQRLTGMFNNDKLAEFTKQIASMSDENLSTLVRNSETRELKKGDKLLMEGNVSDEYYFVEKGYLRSYYNKDGAEINIRFTFEGEVTTNFKSLKTKIPSEFIIEAGEKSIVSILDRKTLFELSLNNQEIMLFTRRVMTRLVMEAEEYGNWFKIFTPSERYRYIQDNKPWILRRISISQLSSYLGVTRETLTRIRRKK